jgi:F-type H+-transporting ATPase subunit alpha
LRRPPGREAFPGDIFYIHSRLLERSTHLSDRLKGGSLTALPIIETEAQDISAYIPTNLISITDGQIYLSPKLFELGILPAVDVGKSVSRVGGKAQLPAYRSITGNLKLAYSQFEELETFSRFGTRLDENTRKIIEHGKRIRACLKQNELHPMTVPEQIVILLALSGGLFDVVPVNRVQEAEAALQKIMTELPKEILSRLFSDNDLSDADRETISKIAGDTLSPFIAKSEPESASASETESKPKSKKEPEPEPEPKSASETEPKSKSNSKQKKEPEPEPDQNQK